MDGSHARRYHLLWIFGRDLCTKIIIIQIETNCIGVVGTQVIANSNYTEKCIIGLENEILILQLSKTGKRECIYRGFDVLRI